MQIYFFDVEHGNCALIRTDLNQHLMVDCGYNSSQNWRPSNFLSYYGIRTLEHLFLTNLDEDHASDFPQLLKTVNIPILHRNPSVNPNHLLQLKKDGVGKAIGIVAYMAENLYTSPIISYPYLGEVYFSEFWNTPYQGFNDTNNLSLVAIFHYHDLHIIFPGDLEKQGWQQLLQNKKFCEELSLVNVFVASHHGRENGYCAEVFNYCQPDIVLMSDKTIMHDTQKMTGSYSQHCKGILFNDGITRYVLTTRNNGHIRINKNGPNKETVCIEKR